jgi:hypothetical protein
MTERSFRLIVGLTLLAALYLDIRPIVYGVIALFFFEGATSWRIPLLVSRFRNKASLANEEVCCSDYKFNFDAERVLRLLATFVLVTTYIIFDKLWLFPWFAGLALTVAGVSGICPILILIKMMGFKSSNVEQGLLLLIHPR